MSKAALLFNVLIREPRTGAVMAEAYLYLAWARLLILVPFRRLGPMLGAHMQETPREGAELEHLRQARRIKDAIAVASKYTPWDSKCLVRAIAGMKMLKRRGIPSTLYLGAGRGERGEMAAHAWLRCGPCYVSGAEEMRRFTVVSTFANLS